MTTHPVDLRDVPGRLEAVASTDLAAQVEPFDSFWEGPEDVASGYAKFSELYRRNYLRYLPHERSARVLVVSCGPGYFVDLLVKQGYDSVVGIDSVGAKVAHARRHKLDCREEHAFEFLAAHKQAFDAIVCEQELNHLTKRERRMFLRLVHESLTPGGTLIVHSRNGANPITGAEALAQTIDHFNTMTEYSLRQVLEQARFARGPTLMQTVGASPVVQAEVVHAVREEMAITLGDVVFRRTDLATGRPPSEAELATCGHLMAGEPGWSGAQMQAEMASVRRTVAEMMPHAVDPLETTSPITAAGHRHAAGTTPT